MFPKSLELPDCLSAIGEGLQGWQPYPGTACADWMNCADVQSKPTPKVNLAPILEVIQLPLFDLAA